VPAAVLGGQRQRRQHPHRPVRAQHRIGQLEQRIRPARQAPVQLAAEGRQQAQGPIRARPVWTPASRHAILNATATASTADFPWTGTDGVAVAASCHANTPDNTGKQREQKPHRLNDKLSERLINRDAG
jgi:hypothetical protein